MGSHQQWAVNRRQASMSLGHVEGKSQGVWELKSQLGQQPVQVEGWSSRGPVEERCAAGRAGCVPATQLSTFHLAEASTGDLSKEGF